MSLRIDNNEWIANCLVIGNTGLGVLGSDIPSSGVNGASFLYDDLSLPADNTKEIRALVLTYPSSGTLIVSEDGSFTFTGAPDGTYDFTYQLYVDGVATGSPATVTLNVGSGISANGVAVSTATASITTQIRLQAGATSISVASSNLSTAISLSSQAVALASASADLSTAAGANFIYANGVASSISTAQLTTDIMLAAIAQASSTGYASLTVGSGTSIAGLTLTVKFKNPNYKISFK